MPPTSSSSLCGVCSICVSLYRCPRCPTRYCSSVCYKAHSAVDCTAAAAIVAAPTTNGAGAGAGAGDDEDDGEDELRARLPPRSLVSLRSDERVTSALRSSRLRAALRAIDSAPDRVAALEAAHRMEGPPLAAFFDDVLVALGVAVREGHGIVFTGLQTTTTTTTTTTSALQR
jgi:hypothetical protein